ncbi:MAG: hypothetical protein WKF61_04010 [Luteimonas sp.]
MTYATKAEWAAAKAHALQRDIRLYPVVPVSDWRRIKSRMRAIDTIRADAMKFERMADRFRTLGQ